MLRSVQSTPVSHDATSTGGSGGDAPSDSTAHKKVAKPSSQPTTSNPTNGAANPSPSNSNKQPNQNKVTGSTGDVNGLDNGQELGSGTQSPSNPSSSTASSMSNPSTTAHSGNSLTWALTSVAAVAAIGIVVMGVFVARHNRNKARGMEQGGASAAGYGQDGHRQSFGKKNPKQVNSICTLPTSPSVQREQFWNPLP
ncbi:hypothetical protein BGX28_003110 [Mortierella sp. GBA30]|nr:hypothetical protein BGX28_003110 [Mortierella sp. GBA30]